MKKFLLTSACILALSCTGSAQAKENSAASQNFLEWGMIGVVAGMCGISPTPAQAKAIEAGMDDAGDKQSEFTTQEQYMSFLKGMAEEIRPHKADVCATAMKQGIDGLIKQAQDGA